MTLHATLRTELSDHFSLDVSLDVPPGITILFGASGSGKSTLLRSIAGLVRPQAGRIAIGDRALFDSVLGQDLPPQRRGVGVVFQNLGLFPHLTVRGNIRFGLHGRDDAGTRERVEAVARRFHVDRLLDRRPRQIGR